MGAISPFPPSVRPQDQIQCYALPYGAVGFISDLLTYYAFACLVYGRRPLMPRKAISRGKLDIGIAIATMLGTCITAGITIRRCQNSRPFLLLAVYKLIMSITMGTAAIHAAVVSTKYDKHSEDFWRVLWWLIPYAGAVIIGAVGLFSLVNLVLHLDLDAATDPLPPHMVRNVIIVTIVFGLVGLGLTMMAGCTIPNSPVAPEVALAAIVPTYFVLFALYNDWVLGAMTGNYLGGTSGDGQGVYWVYFLLKRLLLCIQ